jgi:hypothetical protein
VLYLWNDAFILPYAHYDPLAVLDVAKVAYRVAGDLDTVDQFRFAGTYRLAVDVAGPNFFDFASESALDAFDDVFVWGRRSY